MGVLEGGLRGRWDGSGAALTSGCQVASSRHGGEGALNLLYERSKPLH